LGSNWEADTISVLLIYRSVFISKIFILLFPIQLYYTTNKYLKYFNLQEDIMHYLNKTKYVFAFIAILFLASCVTDPYTGERKMSKTGAGAGIGALAGAGIGALAGGSKGALIGAGIGALAGGAAGNYMDRQETKLREQLQGTGVSVTRQGDNLILNMPGDITFASNQSDIKPGFYDVLNSVVLVLKEFEKTSIHVTGYTDSTGSLEYNITLSEKRAQSVTSYLQAQQIHPARLVTHGKGPQNPVASNDTVAGRARNRRVELMLVPHVQ
jgi:outer membrane protein OmpA-like peptidoglycan-associated protein